MKNFEKGQMVKSITSDQVYRVINIDNNIYEVEHGIDGEGKVAERVRKGKCKRMHLTKE